MSTSKSKHNTIESRAAYSNCAADKGRKDQSDSCMLLSNSLCSTTLHARWRALLTAAITATGREGSWAAARARGRARGGGARGSS